MNEKISDNICDEVRFAISAGDELDSEMKAHIEACEECRTFLEQSEKMLAGLKSMSFDTFTKNGKSVAVSVMEEIERQKLFTNGKQLKKSYGYFRHIGLVAACAVIVVMALPMMNGIFNADKDAAVEYEQKSDTNSSSCEEHIISNCSDGSGLGSLVAGSTADEELTDDIYNEEAAMEAAEAEADSVDSGEIMFKTRPYLADMDNSSIEAEFTTQNTDKSEDMAEFNTEVNDYDFYEGFAVPVKNDGAWGYADKEPEVSDDSKREVFYAEIASGSSVGASNNRYNLFEDGYEDDTEAAFENIEDAAIQGALMYCDSEENIIEDSLVISYTDGDTAYAVFTIENNGDITVYLERENGMWTVIDICDGDITE